MSRITIDEMMMQICDVISQRSVCLKKRFGSVIVKDGRIISMGYNGMLSKFQHCNMPEDCPRWNIKSGTHYELGMCQHAETNAILFAAKNGISTQNADLYVNGSCCSMCARNIISAGIKRVVYREADYDGIQLLEKAGIICIKLEIKEKGI